MGTDFEVTMNEYLPLRDVVFNTLRIEAGRASDGDSAGEQTWSEQNPDP